MTRQTSSGGMMAHPFNARCADLALIVALAFPIALTAGPARSESPGESAHYSIPPQPLDRALRQFAEQSGLQILFKTSEVAGLAAPGLTGAYAATEALARLLEGTGLEYIVHDSGTVVVRRRAARRQATDETFFRGTAARLSKDELMHLAQADTERPAVPATTRALEEVVVTAQKREESLQDVPISIIAVSGENIRAEGISRLEELSARVPNLMISEAVSGSDNMFIRGIGSGINAGFEQAVGQVIDGFFYGRSRFGRASFLDVERIEVLRGPQGALLGKNTSAGAINITTRKPTEEFEAWLEGTYELTADDGYSIEGGVSGPLQDTLKGRLAFRYDDRDGFSKNIADGSEPQEREDITARATLAWEPSDVFDATIAYHYGDFDRRGRTREISFCGPALLGLFAATGVTDDCKLNYRRNALDVRNGVQGPEIFDNDFDTVGLTMNWRVPGHTITSLTGFAQYRSHDRFDTDFTPLELLSLDVIDDYEQWSQELRLVSTGGGVLDYIAGFFFQTFSQDTSFRIHFPGTPPPIRGTRNILSEQENDTFALFGQLTWHISDRWAATLGARFTHEEKQASQEQFASRLYSLDRITLPGGPAALEHQVAQDRTENDFSPAFTLRWYPTDDAMLYGSVRRGFKGGGFDLQLNADQAAAEDNFQFEEEEVTAFEIGGKLSVLQRTAELNFAVFRNEFDDLQVSTITPPALTFNVGNAASAITQGVEIDGRWRVSDRLTLTGRLAYLNAEFDDYPDAPCYFGQTAADGCVGGVQDLGGRDLQFAPDWAATINGEYIWYLPNGMRLTSFLQMRYSDSYALALDLDPHMIQESFVKWDARLSLSPPDERWDLSLIARNIGNNITSNFGNDLSGAPGAGSYFRFAEPPRAVALQGRVRF